MGKRQPYAPFTTSTLQQEAARRLNYSSKKTMSIAQQLYEGVDLPGIGPTTLMTYIRNVATKVVPAPSPVSITPIFTFSIIVCVSVS